MKMLTTGCLHEEKNTYVRNKEEGGRLLEGGAFSGAKYATHQEPGQ